MIRSIGERNSRKDASRVAAELKLAVQSYYTVANNGPTGMGRRRPWLHGRHGRVGECFHFQNRARAVTFEDDRNPWFPAGSDALSDPLLQSREEQQLRLGADGNRDGIDIGDN